MYLLALTVHIALSIYLLDVVTSYLHGTLDSILNINPPPGLLRLLISTNLQTYPSYGPREKWQDHYMVSLALRVNNRT